MKIFHRVCSFGLLYNLPHSTESYHALFLTNKKYNICMSHLPQIAILNTIWTLALVYSNCRMSGIAGCYHVPYLSVANIWRNMELPSWAVQFLLYLWSESWNVHFPCVACILLLLLLLFNCVYAGIDYP